MIFHTNIWIRIKQTAYIVMAILCCSKTTIAQNNILDSLGLCTSVCNINHMILPIMNSGFLGWGAGDGISCLDGAIGNFPFEEYPKDSKQSYLHLARVWLGGIISNDTLALAAGYTSGQPLIPAAGYEYYPDAPPFGYLRHGSTLDPTSPDYEGAISEQDFYGKITDIGRPNTFDVVNHRRNKRMYVQINFATHAWSYTYAEDFILVDVTITNIGTADWKQAYIGINAGGGKGKYVCDSCTAENFSGMMGYLATYPSQAGCNGTDTFNIIWSASNDGQPINGVYYDQPKYDPTSGKLLSSAPNVVGVFPLRRFSPQDYKLSYNWWAVRNPTFTDDFGPRRKQNFRDFRNGYFAYPFGNANVYHVLSNGEVDFDQAYTGQLTSSNPDWVAAPQPKANEIADGALGDQVISFGSFTVQPGASVSFPFAIVGGEHFHHDPHNFENNMPNDPDTYLANLDFSDLVKNANWAEWIYDNPGVDTDGDGYFGESRICVTDSSFVGGQWIPTQADTIWYRGDGVPDWKAAGPPPAPYVKVTPVLNGLKVRFNGERSETEKDIFTQIADFEGYRIYWGRDDRLSSLSTIASYDHEDYDKWIFVSKTDDSGLVSGSYEIRDIPFTKAQLRCLYGSGCDDSAFDPLQFSIAFPYQTADSTFYFTKHDYNVSELGTTTHITKVYPTIRDPRTIPADELTPDDYTEEGHLKFFEYELTIPNLLPTVPYWVNVTAFDFGSPISGLSALETSPTLNIQKAFPASSQAEVDGADLPVYVYPNPYRIDDNYRADGYEGRTRQDFPNDKVRQLNFANLPYRCTIRIYTLDGDLVVEKAHDADPSDPTGRHDYWSLINRNRQIIVSGLYYWTVEEPNGKVQMGKFMVIR